MQYPSTFHDRPASPSSRFPKVGGSPNAATVPAAAPTATSKLDTPLYLTAADGESQSKARRRLYERLSRPVKPTAPAPRAPSVKLNRVAHAAMVERLHFQSMRNREHQQQQMEKKYYPTAPAKLIPEGQMMEMVERMFRAEMHRREQKAQQLQAKIYQTEPPKLLSREEVQDSVDRLYTASIQHQVESLQQLDAKFAFQPCRVHLSLTLAVAGWIDGPNLRRRRSPSRCWWRPASAFPSRN
eukprot:EG_transcript_14229